jgi:hypothetical protein
MAGLSDRDARSCHKRWLRDIRQSFEPASSTNQGMCPGSNSKFELGFIIESHDGGAPSSIVSPGRYMEGL